MAILELTDICKDYQQGKEPVRVLKNINMTVEKGDYLAIMGPSGSGKTTLMNIIGCLDVPTSGSYTLEGRALKDLSDDELAEVRNKHIGFVFQRFYLLPKMDALDNVALPLLYADVPLKERRERAEEALKAVGLGERIHFLPNQLSGGQCQRVAIARAIVGKPGSSRSGQRHRRLHQRQRRGRVRRGHLAELLHPAAGAADRGRQESIPCRFRRGGSGLRRLLPLPGQHQAGQGLRRSLHRPARRLHSGRFGHRRVQPRRHRHGLHRNEIVPSLRKTSVPGR